MTDKQALAWELERARREQLPLARGLDTGSLVVFGVMLALMLAVVVRMLW
jgi:hypothetical protein